LRDQLREPLDVVARARGGEADALLDGVDVLAMPTTRQSPMTIEEAEGILERGDVLEAEAKADFYNTTIFDLTGQPAVSLPCGLTSAGLPVGLMLVARQWDEPTLLRAARAYEMVRGPFPSPPIT
jgi:amidase